jgi:transcriptional regulator with XRE-family HTH domain
MTRTGQQKNAREAEMVRLGSVVKDLRLAAGPSQQHVADELGIHRTTVVRMESGAHDIGASHLPLLAATIGVDATALFADAPEVAAM